MKPRVYSETEHTLISDGFGKTLRVDPRRVWIVDYDDGCGPTWQHFPTFTRALAYAYHVARGGKFWEFCG